MYEPEIKCKYDNVHCLCQWCEFQCNNGQSCHNCDMNNKAIHDVRICTGFVGTYPDGKYSEDIS